MRLRLSFFAALLAVLGMAALLASLSWRNAAQPGPGGTSGAESPSGPEITLRNVDLREIRKGEAPNRLLSEQASFRVVAGDLSASGVTLLLPGRKGEVVVRATEALWDMKAGRILLPAGGSAEGGGGWRADLVSAIVSLPERVLTAPGEALLTGPGLTVAGDNLVWHWREGRLELEQPKTRVLPSRVLGRKG